MSTAMHAAPHAAHIAKLVQVYRSGGIAHDLAEPICMTCNKVAQPGKKLLQCSRCKAVRYCDKKCSLEDWNGRIINGQMMTQRHRDACMPLKQSLEKWPDMQTIARQFPWAKQQVDGTFEFDILRASLNIIGTGAEFGWWTEHPCCQDRSTYTWGFLLLKDQHLQERAGWKLPDNQIPWLDFALSGSSPPKAPPSFDHTWADYYKWRGLPIQSPAALLLHWSLTVYKLLHYLGLVPTHPPTERRHLTVHLLGIEKELDFLPVFGELALLLPNTDIDLILFGEGVTKLLEQARRKPSCLASKPITYTYTAQKAAGSGCIHITLSKAGPYWPGNAADIAHLRSNKPDALIAMNAGLSTYPEWQPAVLASCAFAIPFAITDYMEISLMTNIQSILQILPLTRKSEWFDIILNTAEDDRIYQAPTGSYQITLNPFMCPGPRPSPIGGGPSAVNGHVMIITPGVV